MSKQVNPNLQNRQFYLDNLRIYLTILVIFHHAALTYGGSGDWVGGKDLVDPAVDAISSMFLPIFNGINQSYFMAAFFLLAGYFTPRSFDRKGIKQFLKDRLIRLGIPIIIYTTIIFNLNGYMLDVFRGNLYHLRIRYEPGHLWFLKALIIFAVGYMIFRVLAVRIESTKRLQFYRGTFPPDVILILCITTLSILTFTVRLVFPVGVWFMHIQPAHFVHYIFCFYMGVLAYRGDWFQQLSKKQARRWGIMSLVVIPLLFVIGALGGAFEQPEKFGEYLSGGMHWQSFAYTIWESFLMVGIIVFLLYFFREKLNKTGSIGKSMAINVYTVYIIHQTILVALQILFLRIDIPTILKFLFVSLITVILCFFLSIFIRRIPYARQVLG